MSWYKTKKQFSQKEQTYNKLLSDSFMVKDESKQTWIPYEMTDYQKEFHAESINIQLENAQDILFLKARGISFTWSGIIDYIMTCATFEGITIPIIAQQKSAAQKMIYTAGEIVKNCKIKELRDNLVVTSSKIFFKHTGSSIEAFPSSSAADSVRSLRLIRVHLDEYAFQDQPEALLAACQETMQGDLGQLIIGSTPCGTNNNFAQMVQAIHNGEDLGFILFELPVFDKTKFDKDILPSKQGLEPIAPWISIKKLDKKWKRDKVIFMQENMADFLDDNIAFIKLELVKKCINEELTNKAEEFRESKLRPYETKNPVFVGVDVAEVNDFFAISVFEKVFDRETNKFKYVQLWLDYIRGIELPEIEEYLTELFYYFSTIEKMYIDSTGLGSGLPKYLKKKFGNRIMGINFASSVSVGDGKQRRSIKAVMSTNMRDVMEQGRVELLEDPMQNAHMTIVDYKFSAPKNSDGHGDIFFSNALGLLDAHMKGVNDGMTSVSTADAEYSAMVRKEDVKPFDDWDIESRLAFYKKQNKMKKVTRGEPFK